MCSAPISGLMQHLHWSFFSLRMRTGCTRSTSYKVSEIKLFGIMSALVCDRFIGNEDMYERLMEDRRNSANL